MPHLDQPQTREPTTVPSAGEFDWPTTDSV
jgi:hypothetical protein